MQSVTFKCTWKWGQESQAWCPSSKKRQICGTVVLLKILRYLYFSPFLATCPVSKSCTNSLESLQMQRKRRERWERSDEISNMALFWSLFTWTSKTTFDVIWLKINEFCFPNSCFHSTKVLFWPFWPRWRARKQKKGSLLNLSQDFSSIFQNYKKMLLMQCWIYARMRTIW